MHELGPATRRWRNSDLVRERDRGGLLVLLGLAAILVLMVSPITAHVMFRNRCLQLSYEMSAMRAEREQLVESERRLRVRISKEESLAAVEDWAIRHEGLVEPGPEQIVVVRTRAAGRGDLVAAAVGPAVEQRPDDRDSPR